MKARILWSFAVLVVFFIFISVPTFAQVSTGQPPFGSFANNGGAIINLGNLNFQYGIPILSKPGRGLPFNYVLRFDNSVWFPSGNAWTPVVNWGWHGPSDAVMGRIHVSSSSHHCIDPDTGFLVFYSMHLYGPFTDGFGVTHPGTAWSIDDSLCGPGSDSGPVLTTDGSGYTIDPFGDVIARNGQHISPVSDVGFGSGTLPDSNGNQITATNGVFTDTLGMNVLTASGGAPSPLVFTYKDSSNTSRSVTVNYSPYTVKTNFNCSGIAEYPPTSVSLVSSIVYPDGSSYSFTYEPTPGFSGDVTGRMQSVTLPTGALITYNYDYSGGHNGVVCADGTTAGFDLVTNDGTTSYSHTGSGTNWTTTVLDASTPTRNQTTINFQTAGNNFYETHRTLYSGTTTVLRQTDTCYNGATAPCTGTTISLPFSEIDRYLTLDNNQKSRTRVFVNGFGLATEMDEYDFGNGIWGGLLKRTVTTYATLDNNIVDRPASIIVTDANGNQVAKTTFGYDEGVVTPTSGVPQHASVTGSRGNLTTLGRWFNTTNSNLNTTFTYDDTGNVLTVTDPGGHQISFSYADNFSDGVNRNSLAYLTQVTLPDTNSPGLAHHVMHTQFEPNTGRPSASTDQNGLNTTATYDLMLRPLTINLPGGGQTTFSYPSPTQLVVQRKIDASRSTYATTLLDSYGRVRRTAVANAESTPYDLADVCYDSNGRLKFQSYTYQAASYTGANVCSGAGDTFSYDSLGRIARVMHSDSTYADASYWGRAQEITDEGNGSSNVSRILQSDALGRLTAVCEISSTTLLDSVSANGIPGNCGLDAPAVGTATGFLTSYGYDLLNNLTAVTQGSLMSRSFSYDSLSRMTSESHPEWGSGSQTTYTYNSDGLLTNRTRPAPNQTNTAVTVTTNYGYDALHRLLSRTYTGDPAGTPSAGFNYDESSAWSQALSNTIGRLSSESSGSTGEAFSYDAVGRVLRNWQFTPRVWGGTPYLLSYAYDLAGDLTSAGNGAGVTFGYSYNTAPRLTAITSSLADAQHPTPLLSSVHYGPFGVTSDTLGNGLNESIGYSARGLLNSYSSTPYSFSLTGLAGNGTITAGNDSVNGNWTYSYDEFNRLTASNKNAGAQAFSYDYDRYGNRWHQNVTAGSGPAPQYAFDNTANRISGSGISYDALGNVLTDGLGNSYTWDAENRMIQVNGGATATYTYDAGGRRVRNASTEFLYDLAGRAISLFGATSGVWNYGEIYAGGRHLATYSGSTTNFLHADWLGTKRAMSSVSGTTSETCTSLPFGDGLNCTGTEWGFNHFTDDIHDSETNLEHTWFRQLSTTQARWMSTDPYPGSMDPKAPQSLNRYTYVANRVLSYTDPMGLRERPQFVNPDPPCQGAGCAIWGNNIFDALNGAPGTYIGIDMYGNVGFGFDEQLWVLTENFLDEEISKLRSEQQSGHITSFNENPVLTVIVQDFGTGPIISGLVPEKTELDAQHDWITSQLSKGDQKYIIGLELTHDPFAPQKFIYLIQNFYPNLAPYALSLANGYNDYYDQFVNVFDLKFSLK